MRKSCFATGLALVLAAAAARPAAGVEPKVADRLKPERLVRTELGGEIGRRLADLIYKNYMALDLDRDFLDPFRHRPATDDRRYVGVGKVIDAGARFAAYTGDPEVARRTDRLVEELMKTRDPDGYLGALPVQPDAAQNYRNWVLHDQEYALLGLVDHWRYRGDPSSLRYARELGDYILRTFPKAPDARKICTAGLPEAMLTLYAATGEARYLRFAADTPHGYTRAETEHAAIKDWVKVRLLDPWMNHVYVNVARCNSQVMLDHWEPDDRLFESSRFIFRELTRPGGCLYVTGSASDGEQFIFTQNGKGDVCESCVTAYLIRWFGGLMRLGGDLRYGDLIERAVYNALFAAQDPAGRRIRYFTPFEGPRQYFEVDGFCCPGNYRRIVAELPEMVYYGTDDGGIAVNLFAESRKTIEIGGGRRVTIRQETDYPSSGRVRIEVTPAAAAEFPLRLRIPRWCPKAAISTNGGPALEVRSGGKYHEILRKWAPGDVVTIDMPMPWRLVRGHAAQEWRAALLRGPVLYCIGTAANAELVKQFPDPGVLAIDPASLGEPVADTAVRPGGWKVAAKAWPPGSDCRGPATLDVVLTEFVDPSGIATYFRVPDWNGAIEDELKGEVQPELPGASAKKGT